MSHRTDDDLPRDYTHRWECPSCADWGTNVKGEPCPNCARGRELAQHHDATTNDEVTP